MLFVSGWEYDNTVRETRCMINIIVKINYTFDARHGYRVSFTYLTKTKTKIYKIIKNLFELLIKFK